MFTEAVKVASFFTYPYVGLRSTVGGRTYTLLGSFVVLNAEGWIITSAHIFEEMLAAHRSAAGQEPGDERVAHCSEIWAVPGFQSTKPAVKGGRISPVADLALGKLEPFDADTLRSFPVLRDTNAEPLSQGETVCRYGFPFHAVDASFEESSGFRVAPAAFPVPSFALDGIIARFNRRTSRDGASAMFVETSSPGLRGQSGGPLLDATGRLCGIQSQTAHLDLGFDASYAGDDGTRVIERQFLNVGLASHVDEVRQLLDAEGVSYRTG